MKITDKELQQIVEMQKRRSAGALNTAGADLNEILLGYYCVGGSWKPFGEQAVEVQKAAKERVKQLPPKMVKDQDGRAKVMAEQALAWASANGYKGKVRRVWWTARPGVLARAVDVDVDSRVNPTDTLLQFSDDSFLGLSAKSTKGKADIGFKNPGLGSLSKSLGIDLVEPAGKIVDKYIRKYNMPAVASQRKKWLRDPRNKMQDIAIKGGSEVLKTLRDKLLDHYLNMWEDDLKEHFLNVWIDASKVFPYYIKVTGHGTNGNYSASILDPLNNEKLKALSAEHIELEAAGDNSIIVYAGENKLFRIRLKWESQPLATSVKLSGDPA